MLSPRSADKLGTRFALVNMGRRGMRCTGCTSAAGAPLTWQVVRGHLPSETQKRGVVSRGSTGRGTGLAGQEYTEDGCPASPFFASNGLTKPDTFVTNRQPELAQCVSPLAFNPVTAPTPGLCALIQTHRPPDIIQAHRCAQPAPSHTAVTEHSMGKGDKKSAKGKIWRGSYGNSRPHQSAKKSSAPGKAKKPK